MQLGAPTTVLIVISLAIALLGLPVVLNVTSGLSTISVWSTEIAYTAA